MDVLLHVSISLVCFFHYLNFFSSSNSTVDHKRYFPFRLFFQPYLLYTTASKRIHFNVFFHIDATEQYVRVGTPQDQAMNLAAEMFILLLKTCCTLLRGIHYEVKNTHEGLSAPLRQFLPAIKVFADWLMCHVDVWQVSSIR